MALLRHVAEVVRIPRSLAVPFRFGAPLGDGGPRMQRRVIAQALALLEHPGPAPVLADYRQSEGTTGA